MADMARAIPRERTLDRATWGLLGLIALGACLVIADRLHQASAVVPLNYNEGWNAYQTQWLQRTGSPYPPAGSFVTNNYPPLWFPLVALAGHVTSQLVFAARLVATAGFFLWLSAAAAIGFVLRGRTGAVSCVIVLAGLLSAQADTYIAIADPQMLAQGISAIALCLAIRARSPESRAYAAAMIVAVLAGFVKHNLAPLPLALAVTALFTSRTAARRVIVAAATALVLGYLLGVLVGGVRWPANLLAPRHFLYGKVVDKSIQFYTLNAMGIVLAAVGLYLLPSTHVRRVLGLYLLAALPIGMFFSGGEGTNINVFFDSMVAMAVPGSLVVEGIASVASANRTITLPQWSGAAFIAAWLSVGGVQVAHDLVHRVQHEPVSTREAQYAEDIAYLRSVPGDAICSDPALCYLAGKSYVYDPFNTGQAVVMGTFTAQSVQERLQGTLTVVQKVDWVLGPHWALQPLLDSTFVLARETPTGQFYVRRDIYAGLQHD
jgi:hypothetical protein